MLHSALSVTVGFIVMALLVMIATMLAVRFVLGAPRSTMAGS